jgi:hypothetical protein
MFFRLFSQVGNAIFGFAPGKNSIIKRLYTSKLIDAPLLSVSAFDSRITIGTKDNRNCSSDWQYFPTVSKTGWEFEADIYFSPLGWFNKTRVCVENL